MLEPPLGQVTCWESARKLYWLRDRRVNGKFRASPVRARRAGMPSRHTDLLENATDLSRSGNDPHVR